MYRVIISIFLIFGTLGCAGNIPIHYQQNNPFLTAPNQNRGTPIYVDTQAIIDARQHAQQDFQDGFDSKQLPLIRLQALEDKTQTYQYFYKEEYLEEMHRLTTSRINSYLVVIAIVVLVVVVASGRIEI